MAWRSGAMPIPGGYWLIPSAIAAWAAFNMAGGPSSSGNPWPRFTAPTRAASADISANTVVAYGRSRDTVMGVQGRACVGSRAVQHSQPTGWPGILLGWQQRTSVATIQNPILK